MAKDDMDVEVHIHGACLVCHELLHAGEFVSIKLLQKRGAFPRFNSIGQMSVPDASFLWTHAAHLN